LSDNTSLAALHQHFLAILPRIETHARICFRYLRCPNKREDAVAEVIALAWKWFLRLVEKGKDIDEFVSAVADFAVRQVRSGRRLCGQERWKDVLSFSAQQRNGFRIEPLPQSTRRCRDSIHGAPSGQDRMDAFEERLRDNTKSPVADQAAFRIDFPAWLVQLGPRNREIAQDMACDLRTGELATKYRTTAGRISQIRRKLHLDWRRFHGEQV
jgi:hypothetical protein